MVLSMRMLKWNLLHLVEPDFPRIASYWDHVGGEVLDLALAAAADFAIFVVRLFIIFSMHVGRWR